LVLGSGSLEQKADSSSLKVLSRVEGLIGKRLEGKKARSERQKARRPGSWEQKAWD
jgi:hypothetical protein